MSRRRRQRSRPKPFPKAARKIGLQPGALVYVGAPREGRVSIEVFEYTATELREGHDAPVENALVTPAEGGIVWVDINGVHDPSVIERIGRHYGVHDLNLEDILHTGQRPRVEETGKYVFVVMKMLRFDPAEGAIQTEQVSIVFGERFVLSFQEGRHDVLDPLQARLRKQVPRTRFLNADYLAYSIIDALVDNYFLVLEAIGERLEGLEDDLVSHPMASQLQSIHALKRELLFMRKSVWPLREAISILARSESRLIHDDTRVYIRDLYEHTIQVIDTVETYRDMVSGLLDVYLSSVSNRMNEVMKVLTMIATIFIPLSFLAGVYGMNFDRGSPFNMPELGWPYGYILFWGLALLTVAGLIWFFRRRQWI